MLQKTLCILKTCFKISQNIFGLYYSIGGGIQFFNLADALVATLTCTDPDVGSSGCSNMRITSGDDGIQNKFKLVGNQKIRTTNTPLDYETKMLYNLIIEATDAPSTGSVRTGTMTLVVAVDPVNEFTPSIVGQPLDRRVNKCTFQMNKFFYI